MNFELYHRGPHVPGTMKRFVRWFLIAGSIIAALLVAALLCRDPLMKWIMVYRIRDQTGLRANIGQLTTRLADGSVTLRDFKLRNPPGFGDTDLLVIPELSLVLDPSPAAERKLRFKEVRFHLSEVTVIRDAEGRMNFDAIEKELRTHRRDKSDRTLDFKFAGIERMHLTLGTARYVDLGQPSNNREQNLGVRDEVITDIQNEADFSRWLASFALRLTLQEIYRGGGPAKSWLKLW